MKEFLRPNKVRLIFVMLLAIVVALMGRQASQDYRDIAALQTSGAFASATVTEKHTVHGRSTSVHMSYTFTAAGVTVSRTDQILNYSYNTTPVGGSLPVTYLPSHPQTHCIGPANPAMISDNWQGWLLAFVIVLVIGGILYCVLPFYFR